MTVIFGLLLLAFLFGAPVYFVGLFFFYRKRPRPGIVFWLVNSALAVLWLAFIFIMVVGQWLKTHPAAQTASAPAASPAPATSPTPAAAPLPPGTENDATMISSLHLPSPWWVGSTGNDWVSASEANKQALAAALASASTQQHTAAFFYTNLNAKYNSDSANLWPVSVIFMDLERLGPASPNPTFLGFSWKRIDAKPTPQGNAEVVGVFWQDGHTFIHYQKIQSDGSYTAGGADGPWDGDLVTYTSTTTVSGNNYTILTTAPAAATETGTFQVSADGQELDMANPGHTPIRYTLVAQLVNSIDDIH